MTTPFGFINAFKPPGPSSTAFGSWVRRCLGGVAVGHWGTLDPRACGVLVLAVGRAARLLPLIDDSRKRYTFELVVGTRTDTGDAAGRVLESADPSPDWRERLKDVVPSIIGALEQMPPMHSAVKVGGRPLYRLARAGKTIDRPPRCVTIYDLRLFPPDTFPGKVDFSRPDDGQRNANRIARLSVECDAGTYVRTLCEQLGDRIGVPAHMGLLVRTASGPFGLSASRLPIEIERDPVGSITDPLTVLTHPRVELPAQAADRFAHGNPVMLDDEQLSSDGQLLAIFDGRIIGIGKVASIDGKPQLTPVRVLAKM